MAAIPPIGQLDRDISATLMAQTRRFPIAISRNISKIGNLVTNGAINLSDSHIRQNQNTGAQSSEKFHKILWVNIWGEKLFELQFGLQGVFSDRHDSDNG
jgi:hypothetical protein